MAFEAAAAQQSISSPCQTLLTSYEASLGDVPFRKKIPANAFENAAGAKKETANFFIV